MTAATAVISPPNWWERNTFLLRRLHSLTGVVPVGLFLTFHLLANAAILQGLSAYQFMVNQINALGPLVPILSWTFILIPIAFHGVLGVVYTYSSKPNVELYGYSRNWRYFIQRGSALILVLFIFWHVLTLKFGYLTPFVAEEKVGGGHIAATSTGLALRWSWFIIVFYVLGVVSAVFHWVNGVWTFLITWGVTIGEKAQRKVTWIAAVVGLVLGLLALAAVVRFVTLPVPPGSNMDKMRELRLKEDAEKLGAMSEKENAEIKANHRKSAIGIRHSQSDDDLAISRYTSPVKIAPNQFNESNPAILRKKALQWALEHLRGKYPNHQTGWEITVSRDGLKKATSKTRSQAHYDALAVLPDLLKKAILRESRPDRNRDPNIKSIHRFHVSFQTGETGYDVKLTVKETRAGYKFYDHSLTEIKTPPSHQAGLDSKELEGTAKPGGIDSTFVESMRNIAHSHRTVKPGTTAQKATERARETKNT